MRAQVPYLARLARRTAGPAPLQSPRQLFVSAAYLPVSPSAGDGSAGFPLGLTGEAAAHGFPAGNAGGPAAPSRPDRPGPAQVTLSPPLAQRAESAQVAAATPAASAPAGPVAQPAGPPPSASPQPPTHAEEPPASPRITSQRGEDTSQPGAHTAGNRAGGGLAPIDSAIRAGNAGGPPAPGRPDRPGPAQVTLSPPLAQRAESAQVAATTPATSAPAGPVAQPAGPPPSASPQPPTHAARGGTPGSSAAVPQWGTPVELPHSIERAQVTSAASTRLATGPARPPAWPGPAAPAGTDQGLPWGSTRLGRAVPSGPGPAAADTDQGQLGGGTGTRETPGGWDADRDGGRSPAAAAIRNLLPPPAPAPRSNELAGPGPDGSRREPPGGQPPTRVSIGTIEVIVVPPARPAVRAGESRPPAQMPRGRSRPLSLLAATAGAVRLRDGLRRWYGIAQS